MERLKITFIPREKQKSEYDWADIEFNQERVGKARCLINGNEFTIFSINIYPKYQSHGFGRKFVELAKLKYNKIIADRVRYSAIGFWEKLGFVPDEKKYNWVYCKNHNSKK